MASNEDCPQPEASPEESAAGTHPRAGDRVNSRARHRAPGPPLEHLAGLWGIAPARHIDVQPGRDPVPLVRVLVPGPGPGGDPDGVFAGLTPPLAALLLLSYTRPGGVVLDATSDKAIEGTARAGGRDYRLIDLAEPPNSGAEGRASLVLVPWPIEDTAVSTSSASERGQHLVERLPLLHPNGHALVVVSHIADTDPSILATRIATVATASGLGQLRHLIEIVRPLDDAEPARSHADASMSSGLAAVVSAAAGGRHA